MKKLLGGAVLFAALAAANANPIVIQSCGTSCIDQQLVAGSLLVVARDQTGAPFKSFTVQMGPGAKLARPSGQIQPMDTVAIPGGGSITTTTTIYNTGTKIFVVTTTMTFDARGQLVDVEVTTKSYAKSQIQ